MREKNKHLLYKINKWNKKQYCVEVSLNYFLLKNTEFLLFLNCIAVIFQISAV